ncbi:type VI immunity family protein [Psychrobacter sp. DAB_AL43B]|uniref:type VI immunity family protein n=1 Tax=Psychrobacter sp. DAB_AL43B TaxID=1028416 RepID=UPI0009A58E5D|nr:type VI immunity family protein [Psychrobacter sp. DAB_AL43B]SLJ84718.1 hypothetical protein DABAL43B_1523 [Psychrobacter sp. DAB_AL43B]
MKTLKDMESYKDEFEYFDESLGDKGLTVLSVHLEACFLFWDGHTKEVRQQLKACIEHYMDLFGDNIEWGFDPKGWTQKPIDKLPSFQQTLDNNAHVDDSIEWFVASGSHKELDEVFDYKLSCLTARGWEIQEPSRLIFRIHRNEFYDPVNNQKIIKLFDDCISRLKPYYATMGWSPAYGYDNDRVGIDILDQAHCFFGINIYDVWDIVTLKHGIRSIDWWTYISHELADRVGGINTFKTQIKKQKITYRDYSNGTLLIAGDIPQLLPVDEEIPDSYLKINALTRPMRNGNYGSIGNGYDEGIGYQSFNTYFTDLWMRRFDNPRLWRKLPQPIDNRTLRQPLFEPITLMSAQVCEINGRYRYEEEYDHVRGNPVYFEEPYSRSNDYRQYVVLLKGDVAPYFIKMDRHGHTEEKVAIAWTLFEKL